MPLVRNHDEVGNISLRHFQARTLVWLIFFVVELSVSAAIRPFFIHPRQQQLQHKCLFSCIFFYFSSSVQLLCTFPSRSRLFTSINFSSLADVMLGTVRYCLPLTAFLPSMCALKTPIETKFTTQIISHSIDFEQQSLGARCCKS